jgi:hypothetical protein
VDRPLHLWHSNRELCTEDAHDAGTLVAQRFIGEGQILKVADVPTPANGVIVGGPRT